MRASGILMPVFSLPGPFGIGTLGKEAFAFVDFLAEAKQTYWQILPIGPTGYGDSPYQSFSAFAGNPYFIDYRLLQADGLLTADEVPAARPVGPIDYGALYNERPVILKKAADRLLAAPSPAYETFCHLPMDAIIGMYQAINPNVNGLLNCLLVFNLPFTFVKGVLDAVLCFLIYKPLSPILHGRK